VLRIAGAQMTNRFTSRLGNDLQDFLEFKRSLGMQYDSAEWTLRRFDRFVAQTFPEAGLCQSVGNITPQRVARGGW
jgi:hypothetical protein